MSIADFWLYYIFGAYLGGMLFHWMLCVAGFITGDLEITTQDSVEVAAFIFAVGIFWPFLVLVGLFDKVASFWRVK